MRFSLRQYKSENNFVRELEVAAREYATLESLGRTKRVAIAHIHYFDIWNDVELAIKNICPEEIYITTTLGQLYLDLMKVRFPSATIIQLPNMGRDIYPTIHLANLGVFDSPSVIWKLHTKKSIHTFGGDQWRRNLFFSISGTPGIASAVYKLLNNTDISMVGDDRYLTQLSHGNLEDHKTLFNLWSARNGYLSVDENSTYITGTIFACRSEVLRDLKYLNLSDGNFRTEKSNGRLFNQSFAGKLLLLQYLGFFPYARRIHAKLDLQTRPASSETYGMEAYLGHLARNHGLVVGTLKGIIQSKFTQ